MNLFQDYLNDMMTRAEKAMPTFRPECPKCLQPITGESYNGRCMPCARDLYRTEQSQIQRNREEIKQ